MASNARPISAVLAAARRQPTERKRFIKFLIVGAIGVPIFLAGSIMTGRSFIQRLRRAASGR